MANYILLMTLSENGKKDLLDDPNTVVTAHSEMDAAEVTGLGMYAVLGQYDVVGIIEAPDNEAAARYSLQLGVRIGAHIETMPAIPLAMLEERPDDVLDRLERSMEPAPEA